MNDEMPLSYKGVEFDAKLEQLMRYVRGSAADKLPKEEFCALMESMLTRMMDLSDGQAMIDKENDGLRAEIAASGGRRMRGGCWGDDEQD